MQEQAKENSIFQQTLREIEYRVDLFNQHQFSAESGIVPNPSISVRSISEILTGLRYFQIHETPLNLNLAPIYGGTVATQNNIKEEQKNQYKWNLLPASEGEDSINQELVFEPSFKWITSTLVDPNLLEIDTIECKKVEKGTVAPQWVGHTQLLIINTNKKIYLKSEVKDAENIIKNRFNRFGWLRFKRIKELYFKGKPSLLLKFGDQNSAAFAYYNLFSKLHRQELGQNSELFRVTKNSLRETSKMNKWILLFFRKLPLTMTRQQLLSTFKSQVTPLWLEDPIEICGYKYSLCKVEYLDDALQLCAVFNSKKIKDSKVNIHPKSSKNWKSEDIINEEVQTNLLFAGGTVIQQEK